MWDPRQYRRFATQRARPFFELLARVEAEAPGYVVDLGCGPGELTRTLLDRWPGAVIEGVNSSPEMIAEARTAERLAAATRGAELGHMPPQPLAAEGGRSDVPGGRLSFTLGDLRDWRPSQPVDVLTSNAALQWVPEHRDLLIPWVDTLAPGGWLAFQVPGNFDQPSHTIMRRLAESDRWRRALGDVFLVRQSADPAEYLDMLASAGCVADAWETTYLSVLPGEDAVLEWYKGSGLRPVLAALEPGDAAEFLAEYGAGLRKAYPPQPYGTVLPFRRVFVVARRPTS